MSADLLTGLLLGFYLGPGIRMAALLTDTKTIGWGDKIGYALILIPFWPLMVKGRVND